MDACSATPNIEISKPKSSLFKAVSAGSLGNALEWFDYGLYGCFAPVISSLFFPSSDPLSSLMLTLIVFGVGFIMRPLGGVVFGHYGDKYGRRKVLVATILLMGAATALIGCLPTYAKVGIAAPIGLALLRLVQGISTGGEWSSCMTFLSEYATPYNRGFIVSWSNFSIGIGLLAGTGTGAVITGLLAKEELYSWGWRVPFIFGFIIALASIKLLLKVEETPVYQQQQQVVNNEVKELPLKQVFTTYWKETLINMGVTIGWTISYWVVMAYMPSYIIQILKYPMWLGMSLSSLLLLVFVLTIPFSGILTDKIGRKPVMLIAIVGFLVLSYPLFNLLATVQTPLVLFSVLAILGILQSLMCGAATVFVTEIFPTSVRCSAIGIGYNLIVAVFGGSAPFVVTWLIKSSGNILAPSFYLIGGMVITFLVVALLAKETNRKELT